MKSSPVSYRVEIMPGVVWNRHADQIRASLVNIPKNHHIFPEDHVPTIVPSSYPMEKDHVCVSSEVSDSVPMPEILPEANTADTSETPATVSRRYLLRVRKKPDKLNL